MALWASELTPSSSNAIFVTDGVWAYVDGLRVGWYCRGGSA